jgi:hypothetical protein
MPAGCTLKTKKPSDFRLKALGLNVVSKAPISNNFIEDLQLLIDLTVQLRPLSKMATGSVSNYFNLMCL